jgi:hypothetical protein
MSLVALLRPSSLLPLLEFGVAWFGYLSVKAVLGRPAQLGGLSSAALVWSRDSIADVSVRDRPRRRGWALVRGVLLCRPSAYADALRDPLALRKASALPVLTVLVAMTRTSVWPDPLSVPSALAEQTFARVLMQSGALILWPLIAGFYWLSARLTTRFDTSGAAHVNVDGDRTRAGARRPAFRDFLAAFGFTYSWSPMMAVGTLALAYEPSALELYQSGLYLPFMVGALISVYAAVRGVLYDRRRRYAVLVFLMPLLFYSLILIVFIIGLSALSTPAFVA